MRSAVWVRVGIILGVSCAFYQAGLNLERIVTQGYAVPAYTPAMTIDGGTYSARGHELARSARPWLTADAYHSVGMQLWSGFVLRLTGNQETGGIKIVHFLEWLGIVGWIGVWVWRATKVWGAAIFAVAWASSSQLLQVYCATLQYEILVAFLFVAMIELGSRPAARVRDVALGVLTAVVAIFRLHFIIVGLFTLVLGREPRRRWPGMLAGFLLIALPFNAAYSWARGTFFFFQEGGVGQSEFSLHPNAIGFNWPVQTPVDPRGWRFVVERPLDYVALLGRRALYFTGIQPDIWWVPSLSVCALTKIGLDSALFRALVVIVGSMFVAWGALFAGARTSRDGIPSAYLCLAPFWAILLGQLVVNSSTRYLVPALPGLLYLQALGFYKASRSIAGL